MPAADQRGLVPRPNLTAAEREEVETLRALCNAHDGLSLKLNLGMPGDPPGEGWDQALYYVDGTLAGFCSLDGEKELELCGMVHPAYRRRGIGRALLAAALDESRRRAAQELLLICEAASSAGQAFAAAAGGDAAFAEHHMELAASAIPPAAPADPRLQIRRANPGDADALARVTSSVFGDLVARIREPIARELADPAVRFYLAYLGADPVGSLKVFDIGGKAGIYAFGVVPEHRGRGLGRAIFTAALHLLAAEGWAGFALEVETDNTPALRLYESCGFQTTTTYGYYHLPLGAG